MGQATKPTRKPPGAHCRVPSWSCRSTSSVSGKHRGHLQEWKPQMKNTQEGIRKEMKHMVNHSLQSDFCLAFSCSRFHWPGCALCRCNWARNGMRSHLAQPINALAAPVGGWFSPESPSSHSIFQNRTALNCWGKPPKRTPDLRQGCWLSAAEAWCKNSAVNPRSKIFKNSWSNIARLWFPNKPHYWMYKV